MSDLPTQAVLRLTAQGREQEVRVRRMESAGHVPFESVPGDDEDGGVEVMITTDTSGAPHKAGEGKLYVMWNSADPDGPKLYFTEAEWDAFVLGVKDGEFDLDAEGNLPPLPGSAEQH